MRRCLPFLLPVVLALALPSLAAALAERTREGGAVLLTGHQRELGGLLGARTVELRGGRLQDA